ncbi:DUF2163 domain-containing protein [Histidinibacterium aquaticum]|uniref:DUF2163 domain-containing protein n=1 Tax=Histidinibacterium aquaticum TaxID=2613962 RepID=A0A5J5GL85_9RHOB|nr:DUF2163 domain-containing protein [Histidinibacterium aquaticum]KAA9009041.1 DUF2163 domain-containing protein [Histidinibacterium aquaticum]
MSLAAHLSTGLTTVCRCWLLTRRDGVAMGFTDHDRDLAFAGHVFRADTGMTARQLVQGMGLSVDNTEAMGLLSSGAVREEDIAAGRYDGAMVCAWLVNWQAPAERDIRFRGTLGEITWGGGAFHAELRGQSEALNRPWGRIYTPDCSAVLGDDACGVDLSGLVVEGTVVEVSENSMLRLSLEAQHEPGWFAHGRLDVLDGSAQGLSGMIREDRTDGTDRLVTLWDALRADVSAGDRVRLVPGCDKQPGTCREKFSNFLNFRGFPHIPGEDWLAAVPRREDANDGGQR